ncbi:hypothetical protein XF30_32245 [Bradyrhizobium sp. SUTN9-2]|nr:hypothetical protein XF30_32245 [Bradyrhizobium sp. SUTN9-2]
MLHSLHSCSVGSPFLEKSAMSKGVFIALLALLFLALCEQYWSGGRNSEAALGLARQIEQSFGM